MGRARLVRKRWVAAVFPAPHVAFAGTTARSRPGRNSRRTERRRAHVVRVERSETRAFPALVARARARGLTLATNPIGLQAEAPGVLARFPVRPTTTTEESPLH